MSNPPRRQNTIDNDANTLLKRRDRDKPRQRIVSEKPRRVNTLVHDEDNKVTSNL